MTSPRLIFENIHFFRGPKIILGGIDWQVDAGQHWAVLGPNGSGKSTLLKILLGYESSSRGRTFLLEGWQGDLALQEIRKKVGYVSSALIDHLLRWRGLAPGEEIVTTGRKALIGDHFAATAAEREEARVILRDLGVERLAQQPFRLMSTGERQLCLIGRARMANSEVVIYDEPCAGLDLAAREAVLQALDQACAARPDHPNVLITHHAEEVCPGITHVLLLRQGKVVAQGPKERVLSGENLSTTFGIPVDVIRNNGRFLAVPK